MKTRLPPAAPLLVVVLSACAPAAHTATTAAPVPAAIEARVDSIFAHFGPTTPGCAVGVYRAGDVVFAKGYGMANLEYGVPITPETVFEIASNTKQFTAFAVHMLARQGRLSLDDDVRKYVPELPDLGAVNTLRHLMNNTSGLRDALQMAYLWDPARTNEYPTSRGVAMEMLRRQQALNFAPGERFLYSNSNWLLLGMVIERVDGRSYGEFMRQEVFEPLGMTRTLFRGDPQSIVEGRAVGYLPVPGGGYRTSTVWQLVYDFPGAGFTYSTLADLARWDANFFDERLGGAGIAEAMYTRGVLTRGDTIAYASGLMVGTLAGERIIDHGGAGAGASQLLRFPERRLSVAVLCNQDSEHTPVDDYTRAVAGVFLGWPVPAAPSVAPDVAQRAVNVESIARFAGRYLAPETGHYRHFVVHEGQLAERAPGELWPATALGGGRFEDAQILVEFADDAQSGVLTVKQNGTRIPLVRDDPDPVVEAEALAAFAGTYRSEEADVNWTFRVENGVLTLRRRGAEDLALQRTGRERFSDPEGNVRIVFGRDADGPADHLLVSSSRILNVEFTRIDGRRPEPWP